MKFQSSPPVLYLLFVGVPLAGLLIVLYAGRPLRAPASIGGQWRLDEPSQPAAALACPPAGAPAQGGAPGAGQGAPTAQGQPPAPKWTLEIAQSGPRLTALLGAAEKTAFKGRLAGNVVEATARRSAAPVAAFRAELDRGAQPERLVGTLRLPDCPDAPGGRATNLPFRAVRERGASSGNKQE